MRASRSSPTRGVAVATILVELIPIGDSEARKVPTMICCSSWLDSVVLSERMTFSNLVIRPSTLLTITIRLWD